MKGIRLVITCLLGVLSGVLLFYFYNQDVDQLIHGEQLPVKENNVSVNKISKESQKIGSTGIHMTRLYYSEKKDTLYFGIWFRKGNETVEGDWLKRDGTVQFLVKVINHDGTTFTGHTIGKREGSFTIFQYVKVDDFSLSNDKRNETGKLEVLFYPMKSKDKPNKLPLFKETIKIQP